MGVRFYVRFLGYVRDGILVYFSMSYQNEIAKIKAIGIFHAEESCSNSLTVFTITYEKK